MRYAPNFVTTLPFEEGRGYGREGVVKGGGGIAP